MSSEFGLPIDLAQNVRRLGRLRRSPALRSLVRETRLSREDLIQPLFVVERADDSGPIDSLPGVRRHALHELDRAVDDLTVAGVPGVLVFGVPAFKDEQGSAAWDADGVVPQAVRRIKARAPHLAVITDVCLCQYTSHGQCGLVDAGVIDNDLTIEAIARVAVAHADAGADVVAPSGMMDGGVGAIRRGLDAHGHGEVAILSYAAKFASAFYGPFRDAVHSAPRSGDRRSHQMDPANAREAIREAVQDIAEGADIVMVKPAGAYLDVIARVKRELGAGMGGVPIAAYQVSGEHAMIAAAAANGWIDERAAILESLIAIKRAGADMIITYSASRVARWLTEDATARSAVAMNVAQSGGARS